MSAWSLAINERSPSWRWCMNQNRRERPAINEIASDANSLRFAWLTSTLNSRSRRMKRMSSPASALSYIARAIAAKRARSSVVARDAAERTISRSSSRRTSSIRSCLPTLNSETRTPRRGSTVTSPSRARRCNASRTGVRPMPSVFESAPSESTSPGSSLSVQIISSSATYAWSVRLRSGSVRGPASDSLSLTLKCGSDTRKHVRKWDATTIAAARPGCPDAGMLARHSHHGHGVCGADDSTMGDVQPRFGATP